MSGRHRPDPKGGRSGTPTTSTAANIDARHARPLPEREAGRPPAPSGGGRRRLAGRRVALTVAAIAALVAAGVVVTTLPGDSGGANSASGCIGAETLRVVADPAIAPSIKTIVDNWEQGNPAVNKICVPVTVTEMDSRQAEQTLISESTATVWIPDSTVWSSRLVADAPKLSGRIVINRSVASSPLVVAVSPQRAGAVTAAAQYGLVSALTGSTPAELPSPTVTAEGALALLGMQAQAGSSPAAQGTLGGVFLHLTQQVLPNAAAGFADLKEFPTTAPAFVASEQAVIDANKGKSTPIATAVYPAGVNPGLDFPVVEINPSQVRIFGLALQAFIQQLTFQTGVRVLNDAGLRDGAATPLQGSFADSGNTQITLTDPATPPVLTSVVQRWVAAGAPNQILAVIDVSGSMNAESGNGRSKIAVAAEAGRGAVALMPGSWSFGLWSFSEKPAPDNDWTQLVPLSSVSTNRDVMLKAMRALPGQVGGDTALYATTLAAFQTVSAHYGTNKVNSILLMTDGANTDPDNSSLPALINHLRAAYNPRRPIRINTIAFGKDADVGALKQISGATHGQSYVAHKASDISAIFSEVALQSA
jgi:Ca-activated chloride channel homolog